MFSCNTWRKYSLNFQGKRIKLGQKFLCLVLCSVMCSKINCCKMLCPSMGLHGGKSSLSQKPGFPLLDTNNHTSVGSDHAMRILMHEIFLDTIYVI